MTEKKLCFYALYFEDGIFKDHVLSSIRSLSPFVGKFVFIINGTCNYEGISLLSSYGEVFCRENIGFDAAAYKYIITSPQYHKLLSEFNSCILMNDTFCIVKDSFELIFKEMNSINVDFWGLSHWNPGYSEVTMSILPKHLQSYFLVINKSILESSSFLSFWNNLSVPQSYAEAIMNFEVSFTEYFHNLGYKYTSWLEYIGANDIIIPGNVTYISMPDVLISNYSFPILKAKACRIDNISKLFSILQRIYDESNKHTVKEYIKYQLKNRDHCNIDKLICFAKSHSPLYLYGNGKYSKQLQFLLTNHKIDFNGIIVSSPQRAFQELSLESIELTTNLGIIIAVNKSISKEIEKNIKTHSADINICTMCE